MKTGWKFLDLKDGVIVSRHDASPWVMKKMRTVKAPERACVGLNCSSFINDALGYVDGEVLAKVQYGGKCIHGDDKVTCEKMRIVKAWKWGREQSVKMAIYSAEQVLPNFEKKFPDDKRPRLAIEAARSAASSAASSAARSAASSAYEAASSAASSAARSAYEAARSAASSAYEAASSAASSSARSAARSAASSAARKRIHKFCVEMTKDMQEIQ